MHNIYMYILVNIPYICVNIYIYILRFGIDKDMDSQELSESQLFVLESYTSGDDQRGVLPTHKDD